jgi:L-lactate dehydrogenase complex protein LldG
MASRGEGPKPAIDTAPAALLERFRIKSEVQASTVDIVAATADVPAAVARYLGDMKLPKTAVVQPALAALDWAAAGLTVEARGARDADLVGITGCFCAVAETGTLMMCSAPDTPAAVSLLPETHIAVVQALRIVPYMEDAWNLARRTRQPAARRELHLRSVAHRRHRADHRARRSWSVSRASGDRRGLTCAGC